MPIDLTRLKPVRWWTRQLPRLMQPMRLTLLTVILTQWAAQPGTARVQASTVIPPATPSEVIALGSTRSFTHISGWFTLAVPSKWVIKDNSNDFAMRLSVDEPSNHATVLARTQLFDDSLTPANLGRALRLNVGLHFLHLPRVKKFLREPVVRQSDGSLSMAFTYDAVVDDQTVPMRGEGYLRLHDQTYVSTLAFGVPADQFDRLRPDFLTLFSSFTVHPEAIDPNQLKIDTLVPYRHTDGAFEISRPQDWHISDESVVGSPKVKFFDGVGRAGMIVELNAVPVSRTLDAPMLLVGIQDFIRQEYGQFQHLVIAQPQQESEQRVSLSFDYDAVVNQHTTTMRGLCQMERLSNRLVVFRIIVPASTAPRLSAQLDTVRTSLRLPPEAPAP